MRVLQVVLFASTMIAMSDDGAGLDPHGGIIRHAVADAGCGIDPNGCSDRRDLVLSDEGVGIDPFGRPRSQGGGAMDPNGRPIADEDYSACVDPNGRCRV